MKYRILAHIFLASLIAIPVAIVGFFVFGAKMPPQEAPSTWPFLLRLAYVPATNIWTAVTHIDCDVGGAALLVAIVTGLWLNHLMKSGAKPPEGVGLFHFRDRPNPDGVAMMNRINKRPGGGGHPKFSNFADGR